jgi:hypothetical protein
MLKYRVAAFGSSEHARILGPNPKDRLCHINVYDNVLSITANTHNRDHRQ